MSGFSIISPFPYVFILERIEEHVLGIINLLSALSSMWASVPDSFIVWGQVSCFC